MRLKEAYRIFKSRSGAEVVAWETAKNKAYKAICMKYSGFDRSIMEGRWLAENPNPGIDASHFRLMLQNYGFVYNRETGKQEKKIEGDTTYFVSEFDKSDFLRLVITEKTPTTHFTIYRGQMLIVEELDEVLKKFFK